MLPKGNAAVGQSGGPTAVINESLVATVLALRQIPAIKKIYGMRHGVNGLVQEPPSILDLSRLGAAHLKKIAATPAAALGSSRDKPDPDYCARILDACKRLDIRYFFYIGGNDSSDTCRIVSELASRTGGGGHDMRCFHVPKTIDNDLMENDHTPGYPSCARFQALAFMADSLDNASLPGVKINVVMGRHAGFCTAASALAKGEGKDRDRNGPHLVYVPEIHFDGDRFLREVEAIYAKLGRCQVAVSEGIQDSLGRPIATTLIEGLAKDAHGNVQLSGIAALGDALADLVKKNIMSGGKPIRVRADTFGYLQRCWPDRSPIDAQEARAVGTFAVGLLKKGMMSTSVAIVRRSSKPYRVELKPIPLSHVAGKTRHMPPEFLDGHSAISRKFTDWCRPLVGPLPSMARL